MSSRGFARGRSAAMFLGFLAGFAFTGSAMASNDNWSGFYAGLHAGGVWGDVTVLDTNGGVSDPGPFTYSASGAFGGATAGVNWQAAGLVAGVEADLGYMNLTGASIIDSDHSDPYFQNITLDGGIYGDLTGRLGMALGQTLFYGKGGAAFYTGEARQETTFPGYVTTGTGVFAGWTAGGGIEHQFAPNVSVKLEYLHFDFGPQDGFQTNKGDVDSPIGFEFHNSTSVTADSVKIGVNWNLK